MGKLWPASSAPPDWIAGKGDLAEHGELLDRLHSHHVWILICRLRMGGGFEGVNLAYVLPAQHLLLEKRRHRERPLEALIGEVRGAGIDVPRSLVRQVLTGHEDQVEIGRAERSGGLRCRRLGAATASGKQRQGRAENQ